MGGADEGFGNSTYATSPVVPNQLLERIALASLLKNCRGNGSKTGMEAGIVDVRSGVMARVEVFKEREIGELSADNRCRCKGWKK
jgi:hypothetical protein